MFKYKIYCYFSLIINSVEGQIKIKDIVYIELDKKKRDKVPLQRAVC